jgi:intein-encoded DNA endonuclease-like protein
MKPYNKMTNEEKGLVTNLYYDGLTYKEICDKLEISERAARRVLKEQGINTLLKNRYTLNSAYFKDIDTEEKAYLLGLLYADGFVGDKKHNNIVIGLQECDKQILEDFCKAINFTGKLRYNEKAGGFENSKPQWILNFSSIEMASDLRRLGLYPNKSLTMKELPNIREDLKRHFVRGYFDGDGSISTHINTRKYKDKVYEYTRPHFSIIGTYAFIEELRKLIPVELDVVPSKNSQLGYIVTSCASSARAIYSYLYDDATIFLERKNAKWKEIL